jgi:Permeases of the drug/metabolite transporter (DMT) superfamily
MTQTQTRAGFGKTDALLLLVSLIWAVNFSVVKFATTVFSPLAFSGLRVAVAAAVFFAVAAIRSKPFPVRKDILSLMALGMLGNGIYQLLFVIGVSKTNVGNAVLIVAASPALIAITSRIGGLEHIRRRVLAGIALSLFGVALVVFGSARTHGHTTFLGTLIVFCGTICWAAFTILLGPFARRLDPLHLSAFTMLGGCIPMLIATPFALAATDWSHVGIAAWISILYASVISMGVAYLFWYRGLRVLGPTRTAVYGNLQPVIAIAVAWVFLKESPTLWQGIGTGTIMTGVFLTRT